MDNNYELASVLTLLKDHGVYYVGAYYSGSGDSGSIDNMIYRSKQWTKEFTQEDVHGIDFLSESDIEFKHPDKDDLEHYLSYDIFMDALDNVEDWYNNLGGYGAIMMSTSTGEYFISNNTYREETDVWSHAGVFKAE